MQSYILRKQSELLLFSNIKALKNFEHRSSKKVIVIDGRESVFDEKIVKIFYNKQAL